jgi:hypothetical protein
LLGPVVPQPVSDHGLHARAIAAGEDYCPGCTACVGQTDHLRSPPGPGTVGQVPVGHTFFVLQSRSRGLLFLLITVGSACGYWSALALAMWTAWASRAALRGQVERCGRSARAVGRAGALPTHGPGCSVGSAQIASRQRNSGVALERCPAAMPGRRRAGWSQGCSGAAPSRVRPGPVATARALQRVSSTKTARAPRSSLTSLPGALRAAAEDVAVTVGDHVVRAVRGRRRPRLLSRA